MRELLAYVCDCALNEPQADICEQDIGCAVFNRPADYDTNQDNIVRVNASHLRKKLETYFASEGSLEMLVVDLPKGHYQPLFHDRPAPDELHPVELAAAPEPRSYRRLVWLLACLSAVLALTCGGLLIAVLTRWPAAAPESAETPALRALWSRLLKKGQATAVVLSDSSLGLTQDLIGSPIPLSEYIHPDTWRQAKSLAQRPDAQFAARLEARRRHTDMSSVYAARRILALAGPDQSRITIWFARDFNLREMKSDNVILLGSRRTDPWVEIVESRMHFHFGFDPETRTGYFENQQPLPGELPVYTDDQATSYCQITFLPNQSGTGNILVISGTDVAGTEAGAEFLTSEAGLKRLRQRIPPDGSGEFPYFEALLKSAQIGGSAPGCEIVASRRMPSR